MEIMKYLVLEDDDAFLDVVAPRALTLPPLME